MCGLGHSGCIINGKAYIWGIYGAKETMLCKLPTQINFTDSSVNATQNQIIKDIAMGDCLTLFLTQRVFIFL